MLPPGLPLLARACALALLVGALRLRGPHVPGQARLSRGTLAGAPAARGTLVALTPPLSPLTPERAAPWALRAARPPGQSPCQKVAPGSCRGTLAPAPGQSQLQLRRQRVVVVLAGAFARKQLLVQLALRRRDTRQRARVSNAQRRAHQPTCQASRRGGSGRPKRRASDRRGVVTGCAVSQMLSYPCGLVPQGRAGVGTCSDSLESRRCCESFSKSGSGAALDRPGPPDVHLSADWSAD
eukprot:1193008-Prorocentrum_minimum.AAC.1